MPATLAAAWRRWLAENALMGVAEAELVATLVARGVDAALAEAELAKLRRHPAYQAARGLAARLDRLERQVAGRARLAALDPASRQVPRRAGLSREAFLREHYAANRPVVVTDVVPRWPAFGRWTPEHFRDAYGEVPIEACMEREADPDYDVNAEAHARPTTMGELARRVLDTPESNDFYLIARNRAIGSAGLAPLFDEVGPLPDWLTAADEPGWYSLWFGPGGTLTPLHHDASNIFFCQLYGRKRFRLGAPDQPALLAGARGFYAAPAAAELVEVVLEPGEALFIPVGWWHEVRALSPSISFSILSFAFPNDHEAYFAP